MKGECTVGAHKAPFGPTMRAEDLAHPGGVARVDIAPGDGQGVGSSTTARTARASRGILARSAPLSTGAVVDGSLRVDWSGAGSGETTNRGSALVVAAATGVEVAFSGAQVLVSCVAVTPPRGNPGQPVNCPTMPRPGAGGGESELKRGRRSPGPPCRSGTSDGRRRERRFHDGS